MKCKKCGGYTIRANPCIRCKKKINGYWWKWKAKNKREKIKKMTNPIQIIDEIIKFLNNHRILAAKAALRGLKKEISEEINSREKIIDKWFISECDNKCDPKGHLKGAIGFEDIEKLKEMLREK